MPRKQSRGPWLGREPGRKCIYIYFYDPEDGRVRRRSTGTDDDRRANEALGQFIISRARIAAPSEIQPPERYEVRTALRWYIQERVQELASAPQAAFAARHLLQFFGDAPVSSVTAHVVKRYETDRIAAGIKRGTIRRELAVLSAALNHAVKFGRLTTAPKITLPSPGPSRTRHLDDAEIAALLDACSSVPHLHAFVMVALNTGARKGAVLDLTWLQVQFDAGLIYLNAPEREQTTKRRAVVPMSDTLRAYLVALKERSTSPFVIEYRGGRVSDIKTAFAKACKRAGLVSVSPHVLRHTAGSLMARAGVDPWIIARMLGHSVQKTTELYVHLRPDWLRAGADALGKATRQ